MYNLSTDEGWYDANSIIVSNCDCIAIPVLSGQIYEPDEHIKEWGELYKKSTKTVYGSKPKRHAFREAYQQAYPAAPGESTETQG